MWYDLDMEHIKMIHNIIAEQGLSASKAAQKIGCSPARISEVLGGRRELSIETALLLENEFGLDAKKALFGQLDLKIKKARHKYFGVRKFSSLSEMDKSDSIEDLGRTMEEKFLATFELGWRALDMGIVDEDT